MAAAGPEDAEAVFRQAEELIRRYEDGKQIPLEEALSWTRRKIQNKLHEYRVIRYKGETAGYFRFCREGEGMELDDLYILPLFQNRGIGSFIVDSCCRSTNLPVSLCVFRENTGAARLYQRLGFRVTGTIGDNRYRMRRDGHGTKKG